jgi:hypothetical protein
MAHFEARGWTFKDGQPMKSWQAACVTWKQNAARYPPEISRSGVGGGGLLERAAGIQARYEAFKGVLAQ